MKQPLCLIFNLTTTCDKYCILCCNNYADIRRSLTLDFTSYLHKLDAITTFVQQDNLYGELVFIFTGGEALLYKHGDKNLFDLITVTKATFPSAKIIIKTGGFWPHNQLQNNLVDRIQQNYWYPEIEFRLGWNLYQKAGIGAELRLVYMLKNLLNYQTQVCVDTIYDKSNLITTRDILIHGLQKLGFNLNDDLFAKILSMPQQRHRVKITQHNRTLFLDLGPAYAPNYAATVYDYYNVPAADCSAIGSLPNCLYYSPELKLLHCNDPYVDASIPVLDLSGYSIQDELHFLRQRFNELQKNIKDNNLRFSGQKERCFYCTKFMFKSNKIF